MLDLVLGYQVLSAHGAGPPPHPPRLRHSHPSRLLLRSKVCPLCPVPHYHRSTCQADQRLRRTLRSPGASQPDRRPEDSLEFVEKNRQHNQVKVIILVNC